MRLTTKRVAVREVRRNLAAHLRSEEVTHIGNYANLRAFIVPVKCPQDENRYYMTEAEKRRAIREAVSNFHKAVKLELAQIG